MGPLKLGPIPTSFDRALIAPETTIKQESIVNMQNEYFIANQLKEFVSNNPQNARNGTPGLLPTI
jgi:hypothetical protein